MLKNKKILIVEDEALLALDLAFTMEDMGAQVVGPCHRLGIARDVALSTTIDGAVLDVDLAGETVFPLAEELQRRNVPFVFHTGRKSPDELVRDFQGAAICQKPATPDHVALTLSRLIAAREA